MSWFNNLSDRDWWELVPAVIGAVIGALAGGIPAYLLAVRTSQESLKKEREERSRNQHDRIFRTFLALSECLADAVDHLRVIELQIKNNVSTSLQDYPVSCAIQPIANLNFIQEFDVKSDDLLTFVEGKEIEYAQQIRLSLKKYNSVVDGLRKFTLLKEEFSNFVDQEERLAIDALGAIQGSVPVSVAQRLKIRQAQMESVIAPTRAYLREVTLELIVIAESFGKKARACAPVGTVVIEFEKEGLADLKDELSKYPDIGSTAPPQPHTAATPG